MIRQKRTLCGAIAAAGRGERIHPLSFEMPKPLLPVCNKPIMQIQIEHMRQLGIEDIFIIVGHLSDQIARALGDGSQFGVHLTYIHQKAPLGIAHAVAQLEEYIDTPFLLCLGDIFFATKGLEPMWERFRETGAGAVLGCKREDDSLAMSRNFAIVADDSGAVRRVVEKPRHPTSHWKGCGIYLFDPAIFDAIRRTPRTAMRDEYEITTAIQMFIDDGFPTFLADIVEWDMNVTVPADLVVCNLRELRRQGRDLLLGQEVEIEPGALVVNSVVGDRVTIQGSVRLKDSVVFPDCRLTTDEELCRVIVTPQTIVKCA